MTSSEILMVVFTAVIATTGVIGAIIFGNQLSVMKGQLDAMKIAGEDTKKAADAAQKTAEVAKDTLIAGQRAWIRTDEIALGGGALAFDKNGASVSISFKITNIGNSPAVNVTPHAWLIVLRTGGPFHWQEQQRMCGEIRKQPFGLGFSLFPGETFPSNVGFGAWSLGVNVSPEETEKGLAISADGKHVALYVFGCIDYTFPTDATAHHQTEFILELRKRGPDLISPDEGLIPIDKLTLTDTGIGIGRYAD
jgi:hypothetical protein